MSNERIEKLKFELAVVTAQLAFWQSIVASFEEIEHGDLPPDASHQFDIAAEKVVLDWIDTNRPEGSFECDICYWRGDDKESVEGHKDRAHYSKEHRQPS